MTVTHVLGDHALAADSRLVPSLLQNVPDLSREVGRLLKQVPAGRVTTYGDLARALGDAGAARWVGEYILEHPHDADCLCHRVVRVNGEIGLFITRNDSEKAARLRQEGIRVVGGRVELDRIRFDQFQSSATLAALRELQARVPDQLRLQPLANTLKFVGGVDVSYVSKTEAVAAFVLIEVPSLEFVWSTNIRADVRFPYISGYLTFRELPIFVKLFHEVRAAGREPDVTLVDGNGILHPRRAGSASCFGIATGTPSVGVGKKLLCGRIDANSTDGPNVQCVVHQEEPVGYAVRTSLKNRPFFVSPGHLTDLSTTLKVTQLMLGSGRLPLPIALADRESRREAQRIKARRRQPKR